MNLFVEYTQEEIEVLLSLFKKDYAEIEIFNQMSNYEINQLCIYIKKEKFPPKKLIENYDFIWIVEGGAIEIDKNDKTKIYQKYKSRDLIGINKLFGKKNNPVIIYKESDLIVFKIEEHTEFSSKFYKNLVKYYYKKLSPKDSA